MAATVRGLGAGTAPSALTVTCSGCGHRGTDRAGVADLAVTWLLPDPRDPTGPPHAARFGRACAPTGPLGEITCAGCGDGPILTGTLAEPTDLATAAAVDSWLAETGWRWRIGRSAGPWCVRCSRAVASRTGNRR